jgi:large subunit ribosomal protein L9
MMKVILKEDVPNLGVIGELVRVRDGYGRNFLLPQGKAVLASARSEHELEHQKAPGRAQPLQGQGHGGRGQAEDRAAHDRAPGPVWPSSSASRPPRRSRSCSLGHARDIAKVVEATGIKLDHRRVTLSEKIHTVGKFSAKVRLDGAVVAQVPFWVIAETAPDVEAEKKRVEAAQAAARKAEEDRIAAEKAKMLAASQIKIEKQAPAEGEAEAEQAEVAAAADAADKKSKKSKKA